MFKFESYITPILLSYVNKYIKNFKQEDSQVSLWGGDASFHNLELRLEVLEQELQLPFSFASGHIHELLIHVPWTKLTSEPITITINTIECILKLRNEDDISAEAPSTSKDIRKKVGKKQDTVQTPPGYVQTVINKIVGNITIYCNNLILKYVEEDIVLSVNVKTVKLQSANTEWKPAFNDISSVDIKLRKLISLTDLTICLDKRNASGKIEMYQEPLLYRCSLDIRLFWNYLSPKAKRATVTRIDVRCSRMDFSLTEQQVPMLMRLIFLAMALHSKELNKKKNQQINALTATSDANPVNEDESKNDVSWSGWAWSWMPSLYSTQTYDDVFYDQYANLPGPTFHAGFYMEQASVSLKVTESSAERSFYGSRKVKFVPFLYLQLQGCMVDFVIHGSSWLNVQMGISQAILQPHGDCFCGVKEVASEFEHEYFSSGSKQVNYVSESLFDNQSVENKSERRNYNSSWDYHLETVTEALLLERTPAVAVDYLYVIDLPEDFRSDQLSEFGSDLEYSNLEERALCRIVVGPMVLRLCSGLFHRLQLLQHAAELYDYGPYTVPKQGNSKKPQCFKNVKTLPTKYTANKKAWMTSDVFEIKVMQ